MYASIEKLMEDYSKEVARKAAQDVREEIAFSLIADHKYSLEDIARLTKLPLGKAEELARKKRVK